VSSLVTRVTVTDGVIATDVGDGDGGGDGRIV